MAEGRNWTQTKKMIREIIPERLGFTLNTPEKILMPKNKMLLPNENNMSQAVRR